jgi:hypothetical protein
MPISEDSDVTILGRDIIWTGLLAHTCNPSTQEAGLRQENCEFKADLGYLVGPCLKNKTKKEKKKNKSSFPGSR